MKIELGGTYASWKRRARAGLMLVAIWLGTATMGACEQGGLPPVNATRPSTDAHILSAPHSMSDGSQIPEHRTETVATSIELISHGMIGGMSIDAQGNIYNTNFSESVWRTAPNGETIELNGDFRSASGISS